MPGNGTERGSTQVGRRARGSFRRMLLAALLALMATVYIAGPALADGWPSGGEDQRSAVQHYHR